MQVREVLLQWGRDWLFVKMMPFDVPVSGSQPIAECHWENPIEIDGGRGKALSLYNGEEQTVVDVARFETGPS